MGTIYIIFLCLVLPILIFCSIQRKHRVMKPFVIGMLVFFLSQIVLRIPILQFLQQNIQMQIFMLQGIPYLCFLAVTAGLFEEIGRYIGYQFLKEHLSFWDAIAFGLGHGMIEAVLLTAMPICSLGLLPMNMVWIAGWERVIAIFAHIGFALIIWQGMVRKQIRYVCIAILFHAFFDFMAGYMVLNAFSAILLESILTFNVLLLYVFIYWFLKKERRKL